MPQPTPGDVHVSAALTDISVAYMQTSDVYIADKVFPVVPVVHQADKYYIFSKADFFRDEAQKRADATESAGGGFNLTTDAYSADVWAFHKDIGDQVRANADPGLDIEVASSEFCTQRLLIRRDRLFVANYLNTGIWATDVTGVASSPTGSQTIQWNDDTNSDPITDIANAKVAMLLSTGMEPNKLTMSYPVYQVLIKHPLVVDRIKYTSMPTARSVTRALLAEMFDIGEVIVSKAVYNAAQEGVATNMSWIMGKNALLSYSPPSPGLMIPSAGYIFGWQGYTGLNDIGIRTSSWYEQKIKATRVETEMSFDMHVTGTDLGYFFSAIVA
jgi:uncharacterized membrane protein